MISVSKIKYGIKSQNKYEINRRAKRNKLTVEELIKKEKEEQEFLDKGYLFCNSCKEWKVFNKSNAYCKECCAEKTRKNYDLEKQREYILKKKYGITLEKYNKMLSEQEYKCYICHKHEDKLDRSLAVDHCHKTGKVRGLLCGNCNRFLGQIDDDINIAERLVEYLQKHQDF